ncbi:MATH and LRR domain-containing protein PFE0570w-like [Phymastichus coffea]|uniref:MATH and LRR domain-containing protein PFE0570w-like n=1 Tax=Phymastichus coffea TaxID=108790 RepID=UPI00273BBB82|nr:MATH and LRR domain-containing protein PFE0570w-like [Phymastichus coffea]
MIVDVLLPSEIARLVYGYLLEEKCTESAKTFLNESQNLYECRNFLQFGKAIPSRIHGYALLNMLETFCSINSIVQDQLTLFDSTHKIRKCNDIITQIKFLLEECRNKTLHSTSEPVQSINTVVNGTPSKIYKKRHSGKNENESNVAIQSDDGYQTETPPESSSLHNISSVEATPLEHLPGYTENLQNTKCETSQSMTVKTPIKTTNKFIQSQQIVKNVTSQAVQTLLKDAQTQVHQASQTEKTFQSQEVQTSKGEPDKLVPKLIANSILKLTNKNHKGFEENLNRLTTDVSVIHVQNNLSNFFDPKNLTPETNLCNDLENCGSDQEVINLDNNEDQNYLESARQIDPGIKVSEACIEILEDVQSELLSRTEIHEKIASNINKSMKHTQLQSIQESGSDGTASFINELDKIVGTAVDITENDPMFIELLNSVIQLDDHISSSEEIEMDIDNCQNPNFEENISNENVTIAEEINQSNPQVINTDSMNITPVIESVLLTEKLEMIKEGTSTQNTIVLESVCDGICLANQNTTSNHMLNNVGLDEQCPVNAMQPSFFDKNFLNSSEFSDHKRSTPLKLFTATQNYDSSEWFSTEPLFLSNTVPIKESIVVGMNDIQTATENIVSPVDSFISPIISKENIKIAERTSLICTIENSKTDDTLHTPDIPSVTKSFIPIMPVPVLPVMNVQSGNKALDLPKNNDGENVPSTLQTSPRFISISSLVKNTEFNRYFSIESITVSRMENTVNSVQNSPTAQEIEVDDSVEFTEKRFSPCLKMYKKTEDNAESEKNKSSNGTAVNKIEDFEDCKMKNIQKVMLNPVVNPSANDIVAQTTVIEDKETLEDVLIGETNKKIEKNEDVASKAQKVDINNDINGDSTFKDVSNTANNKTNNKVEDDIEQIIKTVVGETNQINKCSEENSSGMTNKIHNQMNVMTKNVPTLNQTVNIINIEPKDQVGSNKKESLKSLICKTFEPYIDKNKDNIASNYNNEVLTRNTPNILVEEPAKSQRRSLSTPKKPNSHIRALTFETPIYSRSDSKINDITQCASSESAKRNLKRLHESFQSPPVIHYDTDNQVHDSGVLQASTAVANIVAEKENLGAEKTFGADGQLSKEKDMKKEDTKKTWDCDLRMLCHTLEPPIVEIPERNCKIKSKEEGFIKKKKRGKFKTPRNEKKSPYNKTSKMIEKKTPKKMKKHGRTSEHKDHKSKVGRDKNTKAENKLSAKECKDISAQIENNLLSNDKTVSKDEINKVSDKLSTKECKDISAQIESNLLSNNKTVNKEIKKVDNRLFVKECKDTCSQIGCNLLLNENVKVEIKSKDNEKLPVKENTNICIKSNKNLIENQNKNVINEDKTNVRSNENKILLYNQNKVTENDGKKVRNNDKTNSLSSKSEEKSSKLEIHLNRELNNEEVINNVNKNQRITMDFKKTEVVSNIKIISTQSESKKFLPIVSKTTTKKDSLEYLLSDSVNDDEAFNDMMETSSANIRYHEKLPEVGKSFDKNIVEKMVQDEQAIATVLKEADNAINNKYKLNEQDFFPETSLMTDVDESEEESEIQQEVVPLKKDEKFIDKKIVEANNLQPDKKNENQQQNKKHTKLNETINKVPSTLSKRTVDYDSIEEQLSILTNTEVSSAHKVIYDQVHKIEDGKVVSKKYARLKTIDTNLATSKKLTSMSSHKIALDSSSLIKGDDSMEMPPTPQIADPGSNSWIPLIKEDSRTISCSISTPLECPPTPKIFITPQKDEEKTITHVVLQKAKIVPSYHLTPITFETTKQPEVTEFKVVKELLKKTSPKNPSVRKEEESKTDTKMSKFIDSSDRDESSFRLNSEDSDSSSSSDSSDSSSSSSDDDDDGLIQFPVLAKVKEDTEEVNSNFEKKLQPFIYDEHIVAGNEIMFVEHEEVVIAQESSPTKVFSIHKTDKELEEVIKETPAKDENMIPEEGIFETPNISRPLDNPTNLHAKISQIMILKEQENRRLEDQQKLKISNSAQCSPKDELDSYKPQVKSASQVKSVMIEKSEVEVAKAIESITNEKFNESQDEFNVSNGCTILPEVEPVDRVKKSELTKAIQSITNNIKEKSNESLSDYDNSCIGESNLELICKDNEVKSVHCELNIETLADDSLGFENSEIQNTEFHIIFNEANYKKKRRTEFFTDDEMTFTPADEDGNIFATIAPTCVDILLNLVPPKKKSGPKKKIKEEVKEEEEEEFDDGDSSEDFIPTKNTRGGTKRKKLTDQPKSRKRKKNMFIY